MNIQAVMLLILCALVLIAVAVTVAVWFREYRRDEYIENDEYLLDDFYTFSSKRRNDV